MKPEFFKPKESASSKGESGEEIAANYLVSKGYKILARNWRTALGELDIVADTGNFIVFVEVKTSFSEMNYSPSEWVIPAKRRQIGKMAELWIQTVSPVGRLFRFDVVAIKYEKGEWNINHIEDAFSL